VPAARVHKAPGANGVGGVESSQPPTRLAATDDTGGGIGKGPGGSGCGPSGGFGSGGG